VIGLLCLVPLLALSSAWNKSPTFDEPYQIAVGYATWVDGVQHWDFIHPSLGSRWISLPLLFLRPNLPTSITEESELAHQFVLQNGRQLQTLVRWARLMGLLPAVALALGVYHWSRELSGGRAALLGLLCIALDPNMLAHARLAKNDTVMAAGFFWTVYLFWRLNRQHGFWPIVWAGLALGVALTAKYSSLVLVPALWVLMALAGSKEERRQRFGATVAAFAVAGTVIFLDSAMEFVSVAGFGVEQLAIRGKPVVTSWPTWATVRLPLLRYLYGIWFMFFSYSSGRPTFLLGRVLTKGTPLYFPVAFLLKTPVPVLVLVAWGLITACRGLVRSGHAGDRSFRYDAMFLCAAPAAYFILAIPSGLNLGYRHLLPVLPFAYVGIGCLANATRDRWAKLVLAGLVLWLALSSLLVFPHYLAFFNLAAGGPAGGYRYLVDSNLDWGQELISLSEFQSTHQTGRIDLSYFGTADPAAYGIEYDCLPGFGLLECQEAELPTEGWVAVSATCLQGLCTPDPEFYATLRSREPDAVLGHSMFLYDLP
jgi:hypothetical protein